MPLYFFNKIINNIKIVSILFIEYVTLYLYTIKIL